MIFFLSFYPFFPCEKSQRCRVKMKLIRPPGGDVRPCRQRFYKSWRMMQKIEESMKGDAGRIIICRGSGVQYKDLEKVIHCRPRAKRLVLF